MRPERSGQPTFDISHDAQPPETLVVGFSEIGLAGLTAVDYLSDQLGMTETGHLAADQLPAITPVSNGEPRHHTRLFTDDGDLSVLVGELFIPAYAAGPLADEILGWADENGVREITIVSGVPVAHGPDEHVPFYVATEDYREHRLGETDLRPMGTGFLDGVNAEIVQQGIDTDLRVGVLTTPAHPQSPDVDAALRLIDALSNIYDVTIETGPLEDFASQVKQYYADLVERMEQSRADAYPEDRMYM